MYEARELVLVQGEEGYDLTDEILYDDVKYTLTVGDLGGFDINKIGSYEVTYSLTPVTTEGTQGNGQDGMQGNQTITFQRTVTVKAAVEENALYEAPDLYLEWGQEDYDLTEGIIYDKDLYEVKVSDPGDFDIYTLGEYEVTYSLTPLEESLETEETETLETETETEETETQETGTEETETKDPDGSSETESPEEKPVVLAQESITFTRKVYVIETQFALLSLRSGRAVNGDYTVALGTPVWTDNTHAKFQFTNAKIESNGEPITILTITLSTGTLTASDIADADITDINQKSATWLFYDGVEAATVQKKIRNMTFTYEAGMNIDVSVDGNKIEGFDKLPNNSKLTQWTNGHYYLWVNDNTRSWSGAYNEAKSYILGGRKGYLATAINVDEMWYMSNVSTNSSWVGGTDSESRSVQD